MRGAVNLRKRDEKCEGTRVRFREKEHGKVLAAGMTGQQGRNKGTRGV